MYNHGNPSDPQLNYPDPALCHHFHHYAHHHCHHCSTHYLKSRQKVRVDTKINEANNDIVTYLTSLFEENKTINRFKMVTCTHIISLYW